MSNAKIIKYVKSLTEDELFQKSKYLEMNDADYVYNDEYGIKGQKILHVMKRALIHRMIEQEEEKASHIKSNKEKKDAIERFGRPDQQVDSLSYIKSLWIINDE